MNADKDVVIKAVKAICQALRENEIPELEGAIAMLELIESVRKNGLDIHMESNAN